MLRLTEPRSEFFATGEDSDGLQCMLKRHKCRAPSIASLAITDSLLSVLRLDYATKPAASRSQLPVVLVHSLSPESPSRRLFYHLNCRMQD